MLELVIEGLIGEIISSGIETSKDKIKNAIEKRQHKSVNTEIYQVIVDSLNRITYNEYKNNQDKIYESAELLLKSFKEERKDEMKSIKSCLKDICSSVNDDTCALFKDMLYEEICKKEHIELFHEILLRLVEQGNRYNRQENEQIKHMLKEIKQKLNQMSGQDEKNVVIQETKFQNNKKQDYIDNWNSRLFLHQDNDERPITLANAFIMPDYDMYCSNSRIGISENDTLDQAIECFIDYDKTSTMLLTGVPGIGKSSITSWIANKYKDDDRVIILRFRDWEPEELEKGIIKAVCSMLECKKRELNSKILVLDGFDEMKSLDKRQQLLNVFFSDIKDYKNFKCIVTSRPAYINSKYFHNVLELKEFDIKRVEEFVKIITGSDLDIKRKIESNLEVLGIPVILYMAIMSGVDISENPTKPELYNRIFAEKGGIFDRFNDGVNEYSQGSQMMRNSENVKKYLEFLRDTAFKMFEMDTLSLQRKDCNNPELQFQGQPVSVMEFPLKHLFENTEANIEFIHKSVYEYFISEYIFMAIYETIQIDKSKEKLAGVFGDLMKSNRFSPEILEFLRYEIKNKLNNEFDIVNESFQLMLQDGMTYYMEKRCKNVIDCEMRVFANMLDMIHLWERECYTFEESVCTYLSCNTIFLNLERVNLRKANLEEADEIEAYLRRVDLEEVDLIEAYLRRVDLIGANLIGANLRKADLSGANLRRANLRRANLRQTYLRGVDLVGADLEEADLIGAYLREANLIGANLVEANLRKANLIDAIFDERQVEYLEMKYNLESTRVYIEETDEIISYEEYCKRRQ